MRTPNGYSFGKMTSYLRHPRPVNCIWSETKTPSRFSSNPNLGSSSSLVQLFPGCCIVFVIRNYWNSHCFELLAALYPESGASCSLRCQWLKYHTRKSRSLVWSRLENPRWWHSRELVVERPVHHEHANIAVRHGPNVVVKSPANDAATC